MEALLPLPEDGACDDALLASVEGFSGVDSGCEGDGELSDLMSGVVAELASSSLGSVTSRYSMRGAIAHGKMMFQNV